MKNPINLSGVVSRGNRLGEKLGYPTINVEGECDIEFGVYASVVAVRGERYKGALHYGPREVLGDDNPVLEVHLLDFSGDLYGETVQIEVYNKVRDSKSFSDFSSLKAQIADDTEKVRKLEIL